MNYDSNICNKKMYTELKLSTEIIIIEQTKFDAGVEASCLEKEMKLAIRCYAFKG